jgi:hypothetical protein
LGSPPMINEPEMLSWSRRVDRRPTWIHRNGDGRRGSSCHRHLAGSWRRHNAQQLTRHHAQPAVASKPSQAHLDPSEPQARLELAATAGAPPWRGGHASTDDATPCSPLSFVALRQHTTTGHTSPPPVAKAQPPREGKPRRRNHRQGFARRVLWWQLEDENEGKRLWPTADFAPHVA